MSIRVARNEEVDPWTPPGLDCAAHARNWLIGGMEMNIDYGGKYLKIRKALHEAGFDDFHQAGSVSRFYKMNIVAESLILGMRFWFCIDGGYNTPDVYYIIIRNIATDGPDERTYCRNQQEMADRIQAIGKMIAQANDKQYERFKLQ